MKEEKKVENLWPETPEARAKRAPAELRKRNRNSHAIRVQNISASRL